MSDNKEPDRNPVCAGCGCATDPEVCWCGLEVDKHTILTSPAHAVVLLGCRCGEDPGEDVALCNDCDDPVHEGECPPEAP